MKGLTIQMLCTLETNLTPKRVVEARTFLFFLHSPSLFPFWSFPSWRLYPLSEDGGFPCVTSLVTHYTGSQNCLSLGRGKWVRSKMSTGFCQVRRQLSQVWQVSARYRLNLKRFDSSIHSFVYLFKMGRIGKRHNFESAEGRWLGHWAVSLEEFPPVARQEKHEQFLASGKQDYQGHTSSPSSCTYSVTAPCCHQSQWKELYRFSSFVKAPDLIRRGPDRILRWTWPGLWNVPS